MTGNRASPVLFFLFVYCRSVSATVSERVCMMSSIGVVKPSAILPGARLLGGEIELHEPARERRAAENCAREGARALRGLRPGGEDTQGLPAEHGAGLGLTGEVGEKGRGEG